MTDPLRIAFAGTPRFALPSLQALLDSPHEVVAVFSQPDRPAGRGRRLTPPPVAEMARAAGIPVHQPDRLDADAFAGSLDGPVDLLVVVAFGQVLPETVLEQPRHGSVNVHASLLPRWRGAAPIARALLAGDGETGVSIMRMTKGLDTGPVLARARTSIHETDTAETLHDRLALLGAETLMEVLSDLPGHLARAEPQDDASATCAARLERDEARIDWRRPAAEIARAVRAFHPWPGAHTTLDGTGLRIRAAEALPTHAEAPPGTIVGAGRDGIDVATGEGVLRLHEIQLAGRRTVTAQDFTNSRKLEGCRLGAAE